MKSIASNKKIIYYLLGGFLAVGTDYIFYTFTLETAGQNVSKIIGFYAGVGVSFLINSKLAFSNADKNFITSVHFFKYLIALTISMFLNVSVNFISINVFSFLYFNFELAFFTATIFSMCFNFLTMNYWIFK